MIDTDSLPEPEKLFWNTWKHRCIIHPWKWAVCLHHEPPRSLNPDWKTDTTTWYLVCNECHEHLHTINRKKAKEILENAKRLFPIR